MAIAALERPARVEAGRGSEFKRHSAAPWMGLAPLGRAGSTMEIRPAVATSIVQGMRVNEGLPFDELGSTSDAILGDYRHE